jgi:hypothetical protein
MKDQPEFEEEYLSHHYHLYGKQTSGSDRIWQADHLLP